VRHARGLGERDGCCLKGSRFSLVTRTDGISIFDLRDATAHRARNEATAVDAREG